MSPLNAVEYSASLKGILPHLCVLEQVVQVVASGDYEHVGAVKSAAPVTVQYLIDEDVFLQHMSHTELAPGHYTGHGNLVELVNDLKQYYYY